MAYQIQPSDAWISARDRYVQDLSEGEQRMYFKASPESLLDDAITAEGSHGTNSTTRKVMEKLQPFVAAIVQYGEAIDVYSSTYSLALGPIWGSVKVLLHIAREFGKYFDKLVEMFARIGDVLPRFKTYERLFSNHQRLIHALSMAYLDVITFCIDAKAIFRRGQRSSSKRPKDDVRLKARSFNMSRSHHGYNAGSDSASRGGFMQRLSRLRLLTHGALETTLKVTFKLLWKPFDHQFGQQLSGFRQHQKNVEKEAGLAHMIESADARAMVLADQKQLEKRRREDNRLRILAMLHAVDYEAKHRKLQNLRHAGTGDWLYREATYVGWVTSSSSTSLCCRGIPGCGKSILTSNLIDRLICSPSATADSSSHVVYYYCDYADQRTLQFDHILGSLMKQLLFKHKIPEQIETQLLQIYAGGTRSPAETALSDILCSVVALFSEVYIVFDGLDECEKPVWKAMLRVFEQLEALGHSIVKIFITCVEEGYVSHYLASYACVQFSPAVTNEDITAFIQASVRSKIERGDLRIRNPNLQKDIISELLSKANGMFLWVFFQLNDLCESSSDAMIRETLNNLPEGLGETYRRILVTISRIPLRARLAQKIFDWATVAKRPLHVEAFKEAVAFGPDGKSWEEDKIPHEDFMFESCRGLIVKDGDDGTVRFAHHTVRQYLTGGLSTKVDPIFEVSIEDAEALAAQTCVAYLSFSDFESQLTSTTPAVTLEQKGILESGGPMWIPSILGIRKPMFNIPYRLLRGNPAVRPSDSDYWKYLTPQPKPRYSPSIDLKDKYRLICYAIKHWEPHTRSILTTDSVFIRRLENFAKHKVLAFDFRPWGLNQHFGPYGCVGCPSPNAGTPVAKDLPHISMIHYAAKVGNLLLLASHSLTPAKLEDYIHHERYHQETLLIACRHDRIGIVEHLIHHAKHDISDGRAVNAAAAAGSPGVLQYLLSLDQYPVQQQGDVPLLLAAKNGHKAVVGVLAEAGANLNMYDERAAANIIEAAAVGGHDSVILALNATGFRGARSILAHIDTTALHLAAGNGHFAATRALIMSGVATNRLNTNGETALHVAAKSGHSTVVELLLEYGTDPLLTNTTVKERTAFDLAAKNGHLNVLESFNKWYPTEEFPSMPNPLRLAIAGQHNNTIRWLVEKGADVNATMALNENLLCYATRLGCETAVRVLLELGAHSVNEFCVDFEYKAVDYFAKDKNLPILQMLLENIEKDRRNTLEAKRGWILEAFLFAREEGSVRVIEVIEQAFDSYLEGRDFQEMCNEHLILKYQSQH